MELKGRTGLRRIAQVFVAMMLLPVGQLWANEQPKLILQITVDALRGDLPDRFSNVLGKSGFRERSLCRVHGGTCGKGFLVPQGYGSVCHQ